MTNTMIVEEDKSLLKTTFRPIYQAENFADEVQILISPDFASSIENSVVFLQVLLPPAPDDESGKKKGKIKILPVEEELYKGYYKVTFPISSVWTQNCGSAYVWLSVYHVTEDEDPITQLTKTSYATINIVPNKIIEVGPDAPDDDIMKILSDLQQSVEELKDNKMDKVYDYDAENNIIQFYANGEKYGNPIELDKEVNWEGWK